MNFNNNFIPTYGSGWQSLPATTTPITANALNKYDNAILYIESFLNSCGNIINQDTADALYTKNLYLDQVSTLSMTSPTTYSFTNELITLNSTVDVYTNIVGVHPTTMDVNTGTCNVTYPPYSEEVSMACRIYIK